MPRALSTAAVQLTLYRASIEGMVSALVYVVHKTDQMQQKMKHNINMSHCLSMLDQGANLGPFAE